MRKPTRKLAFMRQVLEFSKLKKPTGNKKWKNLQRVRNQFKLTFGTCESDDAVRHKLSNFENLVDKIGGWIEKLYNIHHYVLQKDVINFIRK